MTMLCRLYPRYYNPDFKPRFIPERLETKFEPGELVFVVDMGDLFCDGVHDRWILRVLEIIRKHPKTDFLLLTKNPFRFVELLERYGAEIFTPNMIFGTTVETLNDDLYLIHKVSRAMSPSLRLQWLWTFVDKLREYVDWKPRTFISIEPIMFLWPSYEIDYLVYVCSKMRPIMVYVGYDNYGVLKQLRIPEPKLETVYELVNRLRQIGIEVRTKTMRRAWNEYEHVEARLHN